MAIVPHGKSTVLDGARELNEAPIVASSPNIGSIPAWCYICVAVAFDFMQQTLTELSRSTSTITYPSVRDRSLGTRLLSYPKHEPPVLAYILVTILYTALIISLRSGPVSAHPDQGSG